MKSDELIAKTVNDAGDRVLDEIQISRVIEMAWEDRTPFGAIEHSYGLDETAVIKLMRQELKPSSFRLWRQRVSNRATKHEAKRSFEVGRAYCKTQYKQR
ncbi:TIGR03643 family protein [Psychrobacter sp. Arc29]|uniref:TIGR03643 family protein n=1 Tax=Psychrobacter sp. Arc29 TaxID=3046690 RepID=UPI00352F3795